MASRLRRLSTCALLCAVSFGAQASPWSANPTANDRLVPADQAFRLIGAERRGDLVEVSWDIAPGYYLYRQRLAFEPPAAFGAARLPHGLAHHDEHFGDVEIYRGILQVQLPVRDGSVHQLRIRYQGCADAGVCYPPQTRTVDIGASPSP